MSAPRGLSALAPEDRLARRHGSDREKSVADIFREVDEEVRKDRAKALWQRYGVYVFIVLGALVLGTAANQYWRHYQKDRRLQESAAYQTAVAAADQHADEAIKDFAKLAADGDTGYAVIATLREAAALAEKGDTDGAVKIWDSLAADDGVDEIYRDLARLLAAMHLVDTGTPDAVAERLAPLAAPGNAWRYTAQELQAVLALRQGQRDRARELLQGLVDDAGTPSGGRARAEALLAALESQE
jgi:hypothetical protein